MKKMWGVVCLTGALASVAAFAGEKEIRQAGAEACQRAVQEGRLTAQNVCQLQTIERHQIIDNIYEYSFTVKVGQGVDDVIGIHRVVKESAPNIPIHTSNAVFALHGSVWGFDAAFAASQNSASVPADRSIAVFLAKNDVDVWGMDMRWVHVPSTTTDFTFMKDWGYQTTLNDLGLSLLTARALRLATGSDFGKLNLLGWSLGGSMGYAYLSGETTFPAVFRNVKGFIPVDTAIKFGAADAVSVTAACTRAAGELASYNAGVYSVNTGVLAQTAGYLAATDPTGASPLIPGLNNEQAALLLGAATSVLFNGFPPVPGYHFTAGVFNEFGLPTDLQFTPKSYFFEVAQKASPFEAAKGLLEFDQLLCNQTDLPFDDHLAQVTVPVFYMGAAGAFGQHGLYSTTLLGSTDVTSQVVTLLPPGAEVVDFGHMDLFSATNAETLVWTPILNWLQTH